MTLRNRVAELLLAHCDRIRREALYESNGEGTSDGGQLVALLGSCWA